MGGGHQREGARARPHPVPPRAASVALRRRYAATAEREIFEVPEFQRRVHRAYGRALARLADAGERVAVLDGEKPVDHVSDEVARAVESLRP